MLRPWLRVGRAVLALALLLHAAPAQAQTRAQQISFDPFTNASGQHETAAEPDSFSFGNTVVAVFQLGRFPSGGASGIGFATSVDGGQTWTAGVLPRLTVHGTPAGSFTRVSDPAVAYDRVHAVWLISVLALRDVSRGADLASSIVVSRSPDGITWSAPVTTAAESGLFAHDKNWIVCDNGSASPFAGRCYTTWTAATSRNAVAMNTSLDGGLTWSPPLVTSVFPASGTQPVVQPDGNLVVPYLVGDSEIEAVRSTDGGASLTRAIPVARVETANVVGVRAPPLPSVEVDADGRIYVAWSDCRFRTTCAANLARGLNDIVLSSSLDGVSWSEPTAVATGSTATHFVPGLGVDPTTRGRLAVAYYNLAGPGRISASFVSSGDAGRSWSRPVLLAAARPFADIVETSGGRFVGDYISTSFVDGGVAVPVFATAAAPFDGRYHQAVFAAAIPPLPAAARVEIARLRTSRARGLFTVAAALRTSGAPERLRVSCRARLGRRVLRLAGSRVSATAARCTFRVQGLGRVSGSVEITYLGGSARRAFSYALR